MVTLPNEAGCSPLVSTVTWVVAFGFQVIAAYVPHKLVTSHPACPCTVTDVAVGSSSAFGLNVGAVAGWQDAVSVTLVGRPPACTHPRAQRRLDGATSSVTT